jgi:hypothetical protein
MTDTRNTPTREEYEAAQDDLLIGLAALLTPTIGSALTTILAYVAALDAARVQAEARERMATNLYANAARISTAKAEALIRRILPDPTDAAAEVTRAKEAR